MVCSNIQDPKHSLTVL